MTPLSSDDLVAIVGARRGHFRLESGLHSALWLDLDGLFAEPARIAPFVAALADLLRPHRPEVVCGPLLGGAFLAQRVAQLLDAEFWYTEPDRARDSAALFSARYRLPDALAGRSSGQRIALVDDAMSAGSSLRATYDAVAPKARVVAVGALLQLGTIGADHFVGLEVPVVAVASRPFEVWTPDHCPHCAAGKPLEDS